MLRPLWTPARVLAAGAVVWLLAIPSLWLAAGDASTLDGAWMTSMADAWRWDRVSGRDFYATYGWGFEALGAFATRLHVADSPYDSATLIEVLMSWLGALTLGSALLLSRRLEPAAILLIGAVPAVLSLTQYAWVRSVLMVLVAMATARALEAGERSRWALAAVAGCATGLQALSFDVGVFATVVVLGGGGLMDFLRGAPATPGSNAVVNTGQRLQATARRFAPALLAVALGNAVAFGLFAVGPSGLFDYPRTLLALAGGYRFTMGSPWTLAPEIGLAVGLCVAFVLALAVKDLAQIRAARNLRGGSELPLLAIGSLLALQSGVVRAGLGHLSLAIVPLAVTCAYAICRRGNSWLARASGVIVLLVLFSAWPRAGFQRVLVAAQALAAPSRVWARAQELRRLAPSASAHVPAPMRSADPSAGLLVFPYQNQWALLARRRPVAPFVQAYQASAASLDRQYVERLAGEEPYEVLFGLDNVVSHPIDGVQSVSRSPVLFEYLWRNFRLVDVGDGYGLLVRAAAPRDFASRRLEFERSATSEDLLRIHLAKPEPCAMLRLSLGVDYPVAAALGRPSGIRLAVLRGEATLQESSLVRLSSGYFSTLVSLVPGPEFATVLEGRAVPRQFDQLVLRTADTTFLAVAPSRVQVESIDCLANEG